MRPEKIIKAGVEMTEELHAEVKATAARRRMKMKDAVREAFLAWLEKDSVQKTEQANKETCPSENPNIVLTSVSPSASTSIPPEFAPWVARLLYVLRHDFPKAVTAIKTNLIAFEALTEMGADNAPPPDNTDPAGRTSEEIINALRRGGKRIDELTEKRRRGNPPSRKTA